MSRKDGKNAYYWLTIFLFFSLVLLFFSAYFTFWPKLEGLGYLPWQEREELPRVVPLGSSIGILMQTEGAVVAGFSSVIDASGKPCFPGRDAGLALGDIIMELNGRRVSSVSDLPEIIDRLGLKGQSVFLKVKREKNVFYKKLKPVLSKEAGRYQLGIFVLDDTEGVGTLTFYNPKSGRYGALGHLVLDESSRSNSLLKKGRIVEVNISSVIKAKKGRAGEKIGTYFAGEDKVLGSVEMNTRFGIFGRLQMAPAGNLPALSVLPAHEVTRGPAEILTVISGKKVERFSVMIEKVLPQHFPDDKGMIIRITDRRLLARTGGIVQGMSGSPIIQNGRLAGAVTHVFLNNPLRGYGVLAEWMVRKAS